MKCHGVVKTGSKNSTLLGYEKKVTPGICGIADINTFQGIPKGIEGSSAAHKDEEIAPKEI